MLIGGLQKFSLIDFPGKPCAIVFTQGCNFRCPYCHNPELVYREQFNAPLSENVVLDFLQKRAGLLEAVTVSGGEATLQPDLPNFLRKVKSMGYQTKLETNGTNPAMLRELLDENLLDAVAMDLKAPLFKYASVSGAEHLTKAVAASMEIVKAAPVIKEFRTTFDKTLLSEEDIAAIRALCGGVKYTVSPCLSVEKEPLTRRLTMTVLPRVEHPSAKMPETCPA